MGSKCSLLQTLSARALGFVRRVGCLSTRGNMVEVETV